MLLIYSPRKLAWILICTCVIAIFHIWYLNRAVEVSSFLGQAKFGIFRYSFIQHHVLFWNDFEELQNLECDAYTNCVFKTRRDVLNHFADYTVFDAVIFNEDILNTTDRPWERWDSQIFIFWSLVPSESGPVYKTRNDNFFNWTFTYRLDSTLVLNQFQVRHEDSKKIVAPNISVIWKTNNDHVKPCVERIINKKSKGLAWIVTDCNLKIHPNSYIMELRRHLIRLGVSVDLFSNCTEKQKKGLFVPESSKFNEIIQTYHFLIVIENGTTKDYVSDKILLAYTNYAVPVVYGAANYSRYLPPGSYLNTNEMIPYSLACLMKQAVDDPAFYEGFFNWTNLYEIEVYPPEQDPLCKVCEALIRQKNEPRRSVIANFSQWWNTPEGVKSKLDKSGPN